MKLLPERLERWLATLETLDRSDRIQMLIDVAGRFPRVPAHIAQRPYPTERRVPGCESEAFCRGESAGHLGHGTSGALRGRTFRGAA